mmetsp:Transcript_73437/g.203967  ORF Transcript_73437/g.203967 Transcript_73437/m.203967 type:complete len:116 (-) Transcript_73437:70-417(-)
MGHGGSIEPETFADGTSCGEMAQQIFDALDVDKSGKLSREEFRQLAGQTANDDVRALLDNIFEKMDQPIFLGFGKDGEVSLEEFKQHLIKKRQLMSFDEFRRQAGIWLALATART